MAMALFPILLLGKSMPMAKLKLVLNLQQRAPFLVIAMGSAAPNYTYSTKDLTAGSSALATGKMYLVYE